jgi:hypothetical protein
MDQVIIYPNENGGVVVLYPAPNSGLTIEQVALKDVPHGLPCKIIPYADLPTDLSFFGAWEFDFSNPDHHGAEWGRGSFYAVTAWNEDGTPVLRKEGEMQ